MQILVALVLCIISHGEAAVHCLSAKQLSGAAEKVSSIFFREGREEALRILTSLKNQNEEVYCKALAKLIRDVDSRYQLEEAVSLSTMMLTDCADPTRPLFTMGWAVRQEREHCKAVVPLLQRVPARQIVSFGALLGKTMIRSVCLGELVEPDDFGAMVKVRAMEAFEDRARRMTPYVSAMVSAFISESLGENAQESVEVAIAEACRAPEMVRLLVEATPREHKLLPSNAMVRVDAVGLLQLIHRWMRGGMTVEEGECVGMLIEALRECSLPGCTGREVSGYLWHLFIAVESLMSRDEEGGGNGVWEQ